MTEYLDLADYLLIAEAVLGVPAEEIALARYRARRLRLHAPAAGFGGVEFYPDVFDKAAVLCARLARNHPLPDGNKRVAYLAMLEFLWRNDIDWVPPSADDTAATIERVAAGTISERELADWLRTTRTCGANSAGRRPDTPCSEITRFHHTCREQNRRWKPATVRRFRSRSGGRDPGPDPRSRCQIRRHTRR